MAIPERSLTEIFGEIGLQLQGGTAVESPRGRLAALHPDVALLHQTLANQISSGHHEAVFALNTTGIRFLIDQGVGSQFLLRVNPATGKLRPDGKTIDTFAVVDPDTDPATEELRISLIANKGLITPPSYDPHRIEAGLNPDNVNLSLGSVATLDRGTHDTNVRVQVTQPGHILAVVGANLPDTVAGAQIANLDQRQQPHFTDAKQAKGGEGLLTALSSNDNRPNLFDDPLTRLPLMSAKNPPSGVGNFQIVIPDYLLLKEPDPTQGAKSVHRWDGRVGMSYLLRGEIRLVQANDPETVKQRQEVAWGQVIRKGPQAVSAFTSRVARSAEQKGW